ncbi:MAG: H-NS histone family protein [Boseongicola sp.]|nr:H-NS histone family protein [Boseongicola sp.]
MAIKALSKMSLDDLKAHLADVEDAIESFEKRRLESARQAIEAVAKQHGVSIDEVYGDKKSRKKTKSKAKYANRENKRETWSGRGRQPA